MPLNKVFSHIYKVNLWESSESVSGRGSEIASTQSLRLNLTHLFSQLQIQSILDAPCGDFNWMSQVNLKGINYLGVDIVPKLIEKNQELYGKPTVNFANQDITQDSLPKVDLIICRDCLVHLSYFHIFKALKNFKNSGSSYVLLTTHLQLEENQNIASGSWRAINLQKPPFNFPAPLQLFSDPSDDLRRTPDLSKSLGLWRLEDLVFANPNLFNSYSLSVSFVAAVRNIFPDFQL